MASITLDSFIKKFAEQFDDTPVESFTGATRFRDLDEWSSMIALSIIAMVDEEYEVSLMGNDVRESNTIEDMYKIVSAKVAAL